MRCIGEGSYGEVWLARSATGSLRAVKIVSRQSFDHDRPYEREFDGLKRFEPVSHSHGNQVGILHVGRNDQAGFFYYVMELADNAAGRVTTELPPPASSNSSGRIGNLEIEAECAEVEPYVPRTLKHDLRARGSLPLEECVQIGLALTCALEQLHGRGLVHRDIKPSNIIFVNGRPKLADIGLVTSVDATRSFVGTDGYIPPEGPGTPASDLYSLDKVLYECLTGKDRLEFPDLPADWRTRPDLKQLLEFNEILTKACDNDPRTRYCNAQTMHRDLALLRAGKSVKRRRALEQWRENCRNISAVFAVLTVLALIVVGMLRWPRQAPRLSVAEYGRPSTNAEANRIAATGIGIIRYDHYDEFPEAFTNFYLASRLDTNYALPWAGLLELRLREWHPALPKSTPEDMRQIRDALKKRAPSSAAAYCAQAVVSWFEWRFPEAKHFVNKAINADPDYEQADTWFGFMLASWGDPVRSRAEYAKSMSINAAKATVYRGLARSYYMQGDYPNAIRFCNEALQQNPHHIDAVGLLGWIYEANGDYTNAIHWLEQEELDDGTRQGSAGASPSRESKTTQHYDALRRAFEEGGAPGYWREKWRQTEENPLGDPYRKAVIQMNLGNTTNAIEWLEKSFETERQKMNGDRGHEGLLQRKVPASEQWHARRLIATPPLPDQLTLFVENDVADAEGGLGRHAACDCQSGAERADRG
jgi:serine/threonine protein kinase